MVLGQAAAGCGIGLAGWAGWPARRAAQRGVRFGLLASVGQNRGRNRGRKEKAFSFSKPGFKSLFQKILKPKFEILLWDYFWIMFLDHFGKLETSFLLSNFYKCFKIQI